MKNIIEFKNISKTFKSKNSEVHALKNISLSVQKGDIFGVIGFSGAGKSTLVRMINALEKPTSGSVIVNDENVLELKGENLRGFRKNIGMIFQHFNLLESRTVFQNIAIPLELEHWPKSKITARVNQLLKFVELDEKANFFPNELSGGQKQRVGIARALTLNPEILLCDEATSALDPRTTDSILELLQRINKDLNVTIIMITHQMNVIQKVCNKVAVLEKGELVESGNVIDVFGNPQKETTRGFIRTVINDQLPESVKTYLRDYDKPQKVVRLRFDGKNADNPIMSLAIKETGVNISILYGTVTELEGKVVGFQTVQITGEEKQLTAAETFFKEHNVPAVEVKL
ncbi:ATP-binding cassette domain-containing protein [uncultured Treponema sp.]|uniref:methionine ABC transporter ATP-binding protein n=1 Tax=uncultured Treponema sp. TaxID=162155 RepID=UPI00259452DC|nr:ATP-binding cassette domain-containing protein [uncultured Treponema sp.]